MPAKRQQRRSTNAAGQKKSAPKKGPKGAPKKGVKQGSAKGKKKPAKKGPAKKTTKTAKKGPPKKGGGQQGGPKSGPKKYGGGKSTGGPKKRPSRRAAPRISDQPGERLQKLLAAAGVASRRECEEFIREGRVQVDGEVVTELGTRVDLAEQDVHVDGEPLPKPKKAYFAVHKPNGVVSTANDPSGRPRVIDLLPPSLGRLYNVGRLDMASEGLILVTNDGELANRLTHPSHGVEKIYNVQVAGLPEPDVLKQLQKGVYFAEGKAKVVRAKIKSRRKQSSVLEIVLAEGRNREIRRMLAAVGHKVQRLVRVAVGPVRLGEMPEGSYRKLTPQEVKDLKKVAGM
ncbi:rRNA pseudouridine synthase [Aeoliella sp. ICT_H6.2]|uniref:Pseudouridine synthase n=1 Tax=Aeoliella straminimaris TaxID=2954799 RepID=A0A9X2JIX1_9BACT|nr:rRNA pseudouridine synthase [Aeoliella straminimaris]